MKSKWVRIICSVLVCFTVFCVIAIITRIYTVSDLQLNFVGALLGTVITAVVTVLLLSGQSAAEEVKERNVKIFEKKSKIFQKYIDLVWEVWTDQKVTGEEYQKLTSNYYRKLMIFLKSEKRRKVIGDALTEIGSCLEKDSSEDRKKLQDNIIKIIDTLSSELELGGSIDPNQIKDHNNKLFPVLFRKSILDSFNNALVASNSDILEKGQWLKWNEGKLVHDDLVFKFNKYPDCSIRFGIAVDGNGSLHPAFVCILFVPVGANFHTFDKFRNSVTGLLNRRVNIKNYLDIYKTLPHEEGGMNIPSFNFADESSMINIREKFNFREVSETLAQRANEIFQKITVSDENLTIVDFFEKYYGKGR
jgi:hypothetical protein